VAVYLDTSALAKLVVAEGESQELFHWLGERQGRATGVLVTSDVARTELLRLVRRFAPDRMTRARDVLDTLTITAVTTDLFEAAARIEPVELRSLDALHLASALNLGDDLDVIVCYDQRLSDAASLQGIRVAAPGAMG
jgi:predicted nucleic acid-binding protein